MPELSENTNIDITLLHKQVVFVCKEGLWLAASVFVASWCQRCGSAKGSPAVSG